MSAPRLKAGVWVDALLRRAQSAGAFGCVLIRGDADAGTVLVHLHSAQGEALYEPETRYGPDGEAVRVWRERRGSSAALAEHVARRRGFDADLWLVEIDDPKGRVFLDEEIEPAKPGAAGGPSGG